MDRSSVLNFMLLAMIFMFGDHVMCSDKSSDGDKEEFNDPEVPAQSETEQEAIQQVEQVEEEEFDVEEVDTESVDEIEVLALNESGEEIIVHQDELNVTLLYGKRFDFKTKGINCTEIRCNGETVWKREEAGPIVQGFRYKKNEGKFNLKFGTQFLEIKKTDGEWEGEATAIPDLEFYRLDFDENLVIIPETEYITNLTPRNSVLFTLTSNLQCSEIRLGGSKVWSREGQGSFPKCLTYISSDTIILQFEEVSLILNRIYGQWLVKAKLEKGYLLQYEEDD